MSHDRKENSRRQARKLKRASMTKKDVCLALAAIAKGEKVKLRNSRRYNYDGGSDIYSVACDMGGIEVVLHVPGIQVAKAHRALAARARG